MSRYLISNYYASQLLTSHLYFVVATDIESLLWTYNYQNEIAR